MCRFNKLAFLAAVSVSTVCAAKSSHDRGQGVVKHDAPLAAGGLDADEIGRRFLQLIQRLEPGDEISLGGVADSMGITLAPVIHGRLYNAGDALGGGWRYAVAFQPASSAAAAVARLQFVRSAGGSGNIGDICNLDVGYYHEALKKMGFNDSPGEDAPAERVQWRYRKSSAADGSPALRVTLVARYEMAPEAPRSCVLSIAMSGEP